MAAVGPHILCVLDTDTNDVTAVAEGLTKAAEGFTVAREGFTYAADDSCMHLRYLP